MTIGRFGSNEEFHLVFLVLHDSFCGAFVYFTVDLGELLLNLVIFSWNFIQVKWPLGIHYDLSIGLKYDTEGFLFDLLFAIVFVSLLLHSNLDGTVGTDSLNGFIHFNKI